MSARIVFVSIFDLTQVFFEIARGLQNAGHEVFWITTDPYWTGWLKKNGVAREAILPLVYTPHDFLDAGEEEALVPEMVESETYAGLNINQAMMMDQFVMRKNWADINRYMLLYYREMKRFLTTIRATHLFAEPTNVNEMIAYMLCRRLKISFAAPAILRYPADRLVFFDSYLQSRVRPRNGASETINGANLIESFAAQKPTPDYFRTFNRMPVLNSKKIVSVVKHRLERSKILNQPNLTHHDLSGRLHLAVARIMNSWRLKHLVRYDNLDTLSGKLAFFPLHVQPEASIDVQGSFFSDQLKLIKDIRRALPFDTTLVVKEHPNFLGIKPPAFFRAIRRIPNVKLARHDLSNYDIIQRAAIVFSVSGTAAYEAGLLGIPAVIFSPMFFSGLSSIQYCSDPTRLQVVIRELMTTFRRNYDADCAFMESLVRNSFPARWSDPNIHPEILDPENIRKLQAAFLSVVRHDAD